MSTKEDSVYERVMSLAENYFGIAGEPYKAQLNISDEDFTRLKADIGNIYIKDFPNVLAPTKLETPFGTLYVNTIDIKEMIITPLNYYGY